MSLSNQSSLFTLKRLRPKGVAMSSRGDMIREVLQISKEYEEADQSTMRAFLIISGCWVSSR